MADIVVAGAERVDLAGALGQLRDLAGREWCCARAVRRSTPSCWRPALVDEVCATIGPLLVGGSSKRMIEAATDDTPEHLRLDRLLEDDGVLLARYVRG